MTYPGSIDVTAAPYNCVPGTDCTVGLQMAIDDFDGRIIRLPPGELWTTDELLIENKLGLIISGTGSSFLPPPGAPTYSTTTGSSEIKYKGCNPTNNVFRLKSSQRCEFRNFVVSAVEPASAAFALEATTGSWVMHGHSFYRIAVYGAKPPANVISLFEYGFRMYSAGGANNEFHSWLDCDTQGCKKGWSIEHWPSKHHSLVNCNVHAPVEVGVSCYQGGFNWLTGSCGAATTAVVEIAGQVGGGGHPIVLMGVHAELAAQFLKVGVNTTANPCAISVKNCSHSYNALPYQKLDFIDYSFSGPLVIEGFTLTGVEAAMYIALNVHSYPTGTGPMNADIKNCNFLTTHATGLEIKKPHATWVNAVQYKRNMRFSYTPPVTTLLSEFVDEIVTPEFFV